MKKKKKCVNLPRRQVHKVELVDDDSFSLLGEFFSHMVRHFRRPALGKDSFLKLISCGLVAAENGPEKSFKPYLVQN